MLRYRKLVLGSLIPLLPSNDDVKVGKEFERAPDIIDGWGRLKKMFQIDEFGDMSRELVTVTQTATLSAFVGLIYGGVMSSRTTYTDFMRNNTAEKFESHFEAKRKLQDTIIKSFAKGGFRWGWRASIFSTLFVGSSTMISVYRGKNGIIEYIAAGMIAGTLYKWQMGPRGWIVGGGLGAVLGLISGSMSYGILKLSGLSMDEVRMHQQSLRDYRRDMLGKAAKKYVEEEDELIRTHNAKHQKNDIDI